MAVTEMENVKERPSQVAPVDVPERNAGRPAGSGSGGNGPTGSDPFGAGLPPRRAGKKWLPWVAVAAILVLGLAWRARQAKQPAGPGGGGAGGRGAGRAPDLRVVRTVP
jgi:hypothetical protein